MSKNQRGGSVVKKIKKGVEQWSWWWIKFKSGWLFVSIVLVFVATLFLIVCCCFFHKVSVLYDISFALFSGIIASAIVTYIIGIKQERDRNKKKMALLFDAGFCLTVFEEEYKGFLSNPPEKLSDKIQVLYSICKKPTEYMISLYQNNAELFDLLEIGFLQKINTTYNFLNRLLSCELTDQDIMKYFHAGLSENSLGMQKYWEMVKTIQENLCYLLIKWEKDKIIADTD